MMQCLLYMYWNTLWNFVLYKSWYVVQYFSPLLFQIKVIAHHLSMTWPKVITVVNKLMLYLWILLKVPHKRLKLKLQWYDNTYQWISSFLSDHHQKVYSY